VRGQCDTIAQLLLGSSLRDSKVNRPAWFVEYVSDLAKAQQAGGSWKSGGQLPSQKRPKRETQEVSTMWVLLALDAADMSDDARSAVLQKARAWLGDQTSGQSTEWWATRLMFERRLGRVDKTDQVRQQLLNRQRPDGGWGWLCSDESDALGTGIALFALAGDKSKTSDAAISKARQFLIEKQTDNGSWPVRGTKQTTKDKVQPTAVYWGTCWAVIGLCESLETEVGKPAR
jgi:prenyltransferase beta subunit